MSELCSTAKKQQLQMRHLAEKIAACNMSRKGSSRSCTKNRRHGCYREEGGGLLAVSASSCCVWLGHGVIHGMSASKSKTTSSELYARGRKQHRVSFERNASISIKTKRNICVLHFPTGGYCIQQRGICSAEGLRLYRVRQRSSWLQSPMEFRCKLNGAAEVL